MFKEVIISNCAYNKILYSVKSAENKYEVGGVLVGHRQTNSFYILDATIPEKNKIGSFYSFEIDGEIETRKVNRIIKSYNIKPTPVGIWHSHVSGIESFSFQDRITNQYFAKMYGGIISMIAIPCLQDVSQPIMSYYISCSGNEYHVRLDCNGNRIPKAFLVKSQFIQSKKGRM